MLTLRRLKTTEVGPTREALRAEQGNLCALCSTPVSADQAVLDHEHTTGAIRGTLHRGCNALLGKVENNYKRYGVYNLAAFMGGLARYLQKHETNRTGLLHQSHLTVEEKRVKRNTLARKRRAATKDT
jgi:hypothetical protein